MFMCVSSSTDFNYEYFKFSRYDHKNSHRRHDLNF